MNENRLPVILGTSTNRWRIAISQGVQKTDAHCGVRMTHMSTAHLGVANLKPFCSLLCALTRPTYWSVQVNSDLNEPKRSENVKHLEYRNHPSKHAPELFSGSPIFFSLSFFFTYPFFLCTPAFVFKLRKYVGDYAILIISAPVTRTVGIFPLALLLPPNKVKTEAFTHPLEFSTKWTIVVCALFPQGAGH